MAKESGITMTVTLDDSGDSARDISNDITNLDFATPRAVQDVTGLDKSAIERLLLLADFSCTLNGVFNDAVGASHAVLKDCGTTAVERDLSIAVSGQTLSVDVFVTDYSLARAATGELTWSSPLILADGTAAAWT